MDAQKCLKALLWIVFFLSAEPARPVIIVIHGTFAANERWHASDGDFVRALRSSFSGLPASCPQKKSAIVSFRWSGHNNAQARITAAKDLGNLILSYPDDEPIYLIGHSHAGNVIAILSKFLKNPFLDQKIPGISDVVRSPWGLQEASWDLIVGLPCNDVAQDLLSQCLYRFSTYYSQKDAHLAVRCHGLEGFSSKPALFQKKISIAYLLGTPVDSASYLCDMAVVDRCYALHSASDCIQTVGGFYGRIFPPHKRLLNLRVYLLAGVEKVEGLGHSCLHGPSVGLALLQLPSLIEDALKISPDRFDEYSMMILVLSPQGGVPLVLNSLRGSDGKLHEEISKRFFDDNKKPPTSKRGGSFIEFLCDYSGKRSL